MGRIVELARVEPLHTAVIRDRVAPRDLSRFVPAACGEAWTFLRGPGLPKPGRNVALYLDAGAVEAGVEVAAPFVSRDRIVCSQIPGGLVATTAHFGPYGALGDAHHAVRTWCSQRGHRLSGVSWELYGHWKDEWNADPSKIRTDVSYEIAAVAP